MRACCCVQRARSQHDRRGRLSQPDPALRGRERRQRTATSCSVRDALRSAAAPSARTVGPCQISRLHGLPYRGGAQGQPPSGSAIPVIAQSSVGRLAMSSSFFPLWAHPLLQEAGSLIFPCAAERRLSPSVIRICPGFPLPVSGQSLSNRCVEGAHTTLRQRSAAGSVSHCNPCDLACRAPPRVRRKALPAALAASGCRVEPFYTSALAGCPTIDVTSGVRKGARHEG